VIRIFVFVILKEEDQIPFHRSTVRDTACCCTDALFTCFVVLHFIVHRTIGLTGHIGPLTLVRSSVSPIVQWPASQIVRRIFTARCTIVQSAVLRLHVVRPSVCNVGGSGSHTLEILEINRTRN